MKKPPDTQARLAAGSVRGLGKKKPKLVAELPENLALLPPKEQPIQKVSVFFRLIAILVSVTAIAVLALGFIIGLTVLPIVKLDHSRWLVERSSYIQGRAPIGAVVMNLGEPIERSMSSRFILLVKGDSNGSLVEIVASPLAVISTNAKRQIVVNKVVTPYSSSSKIVKHQLGDAYLAICITGACGIPNTAIEVPTDYILGKVIGKVALSVKLGSVPKPGDTHV